MVNTYDFDEEKKEIVTKEYDLPYCTRILVRRPKTKSSGNCYLDIIN